jgi:hypothetical protein
MKNAEYSLWVRYPDTLPYIIKARRENRSLVDLINDEYRPRDARGAIWLARSR